MDWLARARGDGFYRALYGIQRPGIPRFHLDRFGPFWVATFSGPPAEEALATLPAPLVARWRDEARKGRWIARFLGQGECPEEVVIEHGGLRFAARPLDEIDPGAYPDSAPLREALRREARGRVLNLFAFTCLNGVAARLGGALGAVNVDLARSHLERGKRNYALNALAIDERDFVAEDALRFCARTRERFDVVVADPPPLLRRGKGRVPSKELLEETLRAALSVAAAGATIHLLQCTERVSPAELLERARALLPHGATIEVRTLEVPDLDPSELAPTFKDAVIRLAGGGGAAGDGSPRS